MNILEQSIKYLLDTKPFYANFFLNSKIMFDKPGVERAGAAMTKSGPVMIFNRAFLATLSKETTAAVIEHETLHLLFEHTYEMKSSSYDRQRMNVAMDISINQYIDHLDIEHCSLEQAREESGINLLPEQTWHYYYNSLKAISDKKIERFKIVDSHGNQYEVIADKEWASTDEGKQALRTAVDEAIKASNGNVPQELTKIFDSLRSESKISWKQVLANFIARSTSSISKSTVKRPNRRFGLKVPGKTKKRLLTLGVCIDSSGSINDDQYDQFMTEIVRLSSICSKVHIVEADCTVQRVETVKKGKKPELKRKGFGGTAYQPAITKCLELDCDAIVYFGDMDSADKPNNPHKPFLWVISGHQSPPGDFGGKIYL